MREMARKLHYKKDPHRESKADDDIAWIKEMMQKPQLVNIFSSFNQFLAASFSEAT